MQYGKYPTPPLRTLVAALLLTLSTTSFSEVLIYGNATSEDQSFVFGNPWVVEHQGGAVYGLLAQNGYAAAATGNNIDITVKNLTSTGAANWQDPDNKAYGALASISTSDTGSRVLLGNESTDTISIDVSARGWAHGIGTLNDNAHKQYGAPELVVTANTLNLTVHSEETYAYGIIAQNGTTEATGRAHTVINAENTYVTVSTNADSLGEPGAAGLVAMSQGQLDVNGNLYVTATSPEGGSAILTRGDSVTNINTTGTNTVQLNGDIRFDYSTLNSYTKVDATVNLKLTNSDSFLNGNILVAGNPPTGKDTVLDMNLTLANGGIWSATDDSFVNRLTLDGGVIRITESDAKIDVLNEFAGNGTVVLAAEKTQDGGFTAAGFALASAVKPSEDSSLAITYSGITSDDVDDVETAFNELNENVSTTGVKQTRTIAEGDIIGKITQTVDAEGNTVSSSVAKNTKLDAFEGVNAATLMAWRNEINHLTKRLGDVRDEASSMGAWARVYGGESTYSDAVDVEVDQTTVQVGLDGRVGDWIVGGAFSYANGDADITNGEADTDGYTFALYGTRFFESGAYVDAIARVGRLSTDMTAGDMKGSYDNNAFSLSAEVGHNFKFLERAFVEPQFELTYGYVTGDDFSPKAGVKIEQDDFQMLIARLGARVGWQFERNAGGLYAQASVNHDFLGDADGEASEGALHQDLNADLGGTWLTYGVGFQFRPTDKTAFYGELERSTGGEVKDHYAFNVGARYAW